ncbi:putative LRR receptor-like serine/threonine-protein kinase [Cucumis melo var. makuwa]|uniref:LRR receptor-like serine/threonine-protein kinase n=1 Tax=Cucumis melo var. makuwa TaxID=1194695 RepID=A0A5A7VGE6_CUCMM|nr:putative LRR receptor-like serine/threonine-protein kinase [Cucumis melo var. makuwa]
MKWENGHPKSYEPWRRKTNLQEFTKRYLDSSGVQGDIPPTFSNLTNLQTVWASDNKLTGEIPGFIGSWLKLRSFPVTLDFEFNGDRLKCKKQR